MNIFIQIGQWIGETARDLVYWSQWLNSPVGWLILILFVVIAAYFPAKAAKKLLTPLPWVMLGMAILASYFLWGQFHYWTLCLFAFPVLVLFMEGAARKGGATVCVIGDMVWDMNDFCRGWLISGVTGCGKTQSAINTIAHQLFQKASSPKWGGVCVDEKGTYYESFVEMAATYERSEDIVVLQTRPSDASEDWKPKATINLLGDERIPSTTYASAIVDTAAAVSGGSDDKGFFKNQATIQIAKCIDLLRIMGRSPTLSDIYAILTDTQQLIACLKEVESRAKDDTRVRKVHRHFIGEGFLKQPADQLGGIVSTIQTYLVNYTEEEISDVFCAYDPTFNIKQIDAGKIACVVTPQKWQKERQVICTILKLLFYQHGLSRFDEGKKALVNKNMLILWQDEWQRFATPADSNVDVTREAKVTTVAAVQSKMSAYEPLGGEKKAKVVMLNLRNRIIMQSADDECAKDSAEFIGKKMVWKKSFSYSGGGRGSSVSKSEEEQFHARPQELRELKKFWGVVCHASNGWRKMLLPPIQPDGKLPDWFKG